MATQNHTTSGGYMSEYQQAFTTVPHTTEASGVITDVNTSQQVEMRATDPGFREKYGYPEGAMAVHRSFNPHEEA